MPTIRISARTVNQISLTQSGQEFYRDSDLLGFGIRVGTKTMTYFAEKRVDGRTVRHSLGVHGQITPDQARKAAQVALGEMTSGQDLNAERKAERRARADHRLSQNQAAKHTLGRLCDWYVHHLRTAGKVSACDVELTFRKYVKGSEYETIPAKEFTSKQATALIRSVVEQGKGRTAAKLRSFLRAAYSLALGAETNPEAPAELVLFQVENNPVAVTSSLSRFTREREVVLSEAELGEFMRLLSKSLADEYDDALAALMLSILLGGQRLVQVLRITPSDVNLDQRTVTIYDPKGRRKEPRRHILPMTEAAFEHVQIVMQHIRGPWLFGDKRTSTSPNTMARKGRELMALAQQNLVKIDPQKYRIDPAREIKSQDLRRTTETMMAAMGISKDIRAQIQSHGLGGVQDRHYDRHNYMEEKKRALEAWNERLNALMENRPEASNVRRLKRA